MNKATLIGRLAADPELRQTGSGIAVTSFTIAVDRLDRHRRMEKHRRVRLQIFPERFPHRYRRFHSDQNVGRQIRPETQIRRDRC